MKPFTSKRAGQRSSRSHEALKFLRVLNSAFRVEMSLVTSAATIFQSRARKAALLLFSIAVLLAGGVAEMRGQSALDGFDPNANGIVRVVVVQPDGKILIGGDFTTLSPNGGAAVMRNRIARLNPDSTLDPDFNPNASGAVHSIVVQTDGQILVGGQFNTIGGQTRNCIARLDPTGLADSFNPNADDMVRSIAVQQDGKILVGGDFLTIGGQTRQRIARLDPASGLADSFDPNAQGVVYAIAVQPDGQILVGGDFFSIGGVLRSRITRLDATTGLPDSFDPNANDTVRSIAMQADGRILAGGRFTNIGSQSRGGFARIHPASGAADSLNLVSPGDVFSISVLPDGNVLAGGTFVTGFGPFPSIALINSVTGTRTFRGTGVAYASAVQSDGKLLVGGTFSGANSMGDQTRNRIARLETDGRVDKTLDISVVGQSVGATAVQPDGKILIGGNFTSVLGVNRNNIARLHSDGTLDAAFDPSATGSEFVTIGSIVVQPDGKILVGGDFTSIGGQPRNYVARLDATTGAADSFNPNADAGVNAIALQEDGKIVVGGSFGNIGGQARNSIARLDAATGLADSFNPNANEPVYSIVVQPDKRLLVGGVFASTNSIGGQTRNHLARLDATTGLAEPFNPNANDAVGPIAIDAAGNIVIGGYFTAVGFAGAKFIALLSSDGAPTLNTPRANNWVYSIAVQADRRIHVGGKFTIFGAYARNRIARLRASPPLEPELMYNPNANGDVYSMAMQSDGKVLIGGLFSLVGGQARTRFARLSNDTAARQFLIITQNTITWTHAGASPQFTRVTFESSSDRVNYTPLGSGTPSGSDWFLTGLNLGVGENLYIRARGHYRSGIHNASESITESVRNVFIALPPSPLLNIQRSGNTNVVLSWATNPPGFTLESKTNLNTNVWSGVTPAPVVNGTNNVVTNTVSGSTRFYRLRQ